MNNLLSNPIFVIFGAFVVLAIGVLLGLLLSSFFREDSDKGGSKKTKSPNQNLVEIAHLWCDQRDRRMVFQIENEYYKRSSDLTPKEKEILLKVVMDFYQWLEPPSTIKPEAAEKISVPDSAMDARLTAVTLENKPEPKRPGFRPMEIFTQALEAEVSTSAIPAQSIVAQIDAILQENLNAANMQKWAVRLVEFPDRGMVVMVGLEQYEGIDAVPYERVRVMIRQAVAEWERRVG